MAFPCSDADSLDPMDHILSFDVSFIIPKNYINDDIHIHGCNDETSLSHLKSSCFICSLFGSYFGGGFSFTSCMKEYMNNYLDAPYILLEQHYRTWDPHLCQWGKFDKIPNACVYVPHNDLLSQMYKHFHDFLVRHLLDVNSYYVVI